MTTETEKLRSDLASAIEVLKEMQPELRSLIYKQYKGTLHYPDQQRKYNDDLAVCDRAAAEIAKHSAATPKPAQEE